MRMTTHRLMSLLASGLACANLCGCASDTTDSGPEPEGDALRGAYIEQVDAVRVLHLFGTPYERGYAHGTLVGSEIIELMQEFVFDYALGQMTNLDYAQVCQLVGERAAWPDEALEEMQGMLDGIRASLPFDERSFDIPGVGTREIELIDIMAGNSFGDWSRIGGCSGFAAWADATGGPTIHGRNLDYTSGDGAMLPHQIVIAIEPDVGPQWVSIGRTGDIGCNSCMNEHGLTMEGNNGGDGLPLVHSSGLMARSMLARAAVGQLGAGDEPIADALALYHANPISVSQNALYATPYGQGKPDDQVAAVFEVDGNDFDAGATHRAPSETQYSGLGRTDVIIETNHMLKRIDQPGGADSVERYDEIARRIDVATDPADPDNPTGDDVLDAIDATWIMQGAKRAHTVQHFVFEPDELRVHVSLQPEMDVPATDVPLTTLSWTQLFPAR